MLISALNYITAYFRPFKVYIFTVKAKWEVKSVTSTLVVNYRAVILQYLYFIIK